MLRLTLVAAATIAAAACAGPAALTPSATQTAPATLGPSPIMSEDWDPPPSLFVDFPFPEPPEGPNDAWLNARRSFAQAVLFQLAFALDEAKNLYQRSIDSYPTPEAYTFLAWAHSWAGEYEQAIDVAKRAIDLDPEYGNPYNDIGLYLIELGRLEEAVPWLQRAMDAPRYADPQFPHLNLGRIRALQGEWEAALDQFVAAWEARPERVQAGFPSVPGGEFLPVRNDAPDRETATAVTQGLAAFVSAWNLRDATGVIAWSAPPGTAGKEDLLLDLAGAKFAGATLTVTEIEVVHTDGSSALVVTETEERGLSWGRTYLMGLVGGSWRVVAVLE